jgi:malonyl CoA-acyl carrier protein transacylase
MVRIRKSEKERRLTIGVSLSNERGNLMARFRRAYAWRHGHEPSEADIRVAVRHLADEAIQAYVKAAEDDERLLGLPRPGGQREPQS